MKSYPLEATAMSKISSETVTGVDQCTLPVLFPTCYYNIEGLE